MVKSLEERFIGFARGVNRSDCIDDLPLTPQQKATEIADFFFNDRQVVCEIKSLKKDTSIKVEKILEPHQNRPEWPVFYGAWEVSKILKYLPDSEQITQEIFDAITTAIKELMRKANRQIRETKRTFGIPSAEGVLLILNDLVDILTPIVILKKIVRLYKKRTPDGQAQFPELTITWILSETHYAELSPNLRVFPEIIVPADGADQGSTFKYVSFLCREWAAYNGRPFAQLGGDHIEVIEFESLKEERDLSKKEITNDEAWRLQYRQQRYLAGLSKDKLILCAEHLFLAITPGMLEGGTEEEKKRLMDLQERLAHFFEEVNLRGMDIREFSPAIKEVGRRLKEMQRFNIP